MSGTVDDADPVATIIPRPEADACGAVGCHETEDLVGIVPENAGRRTLCPEHFLDYLEEVSE